MQDKMSENTRKRSRFGDVEEEDKEHELEPPRKVLSAEERAKQIAAKLGSLMPTSNGATNESSNSGGDNKAGSSLEIRKKVYVPKDNPDVNYIGVLIGPQGRTHRKLEEESGAKISIKGRGSTRGNDPEEEGDEDLHVLIISDDESRVKHAEDLVRKILFDPQHWKNLKSQQLRALASGTDTSYGSGHAGARVDGPGVATKTLFVEKAIVGSVIGRNGDVIRDLKNQSGALIEVEDGQLDPDQKRKIHIRGNQESVDRATEMINAIIKERQEFLSERQNSSGGGGDHGQHGYSMEFTYTVKSNVVGLVIGSRGSTIQSIQRLCDCKIQVPKVNDADDPLNRTISIYCNSEDAFEKAKVEIERAIAPNPVSGGYDNFQDTQQRGRQPSTGSEREDYPIPNSKVGLIIGRGGSTMKGITQRTGAHLYFPKVPDADNPSMRSVQISGSYDQIQNAKAEIDTIIYNYNNNISSQYNPYQQQQHQQQSNHWQQSHHHQQQGAYQYSYGAAGYSYPQAYAGAGSYAAGGHDPQQGAPGNPNQKYTQAEWKAWADYYNQMGYQMPEKCPDHLLKKD